MIGEGNGPRGGSADHHYYCIICALTSWRTRNFVRWPGHFLPFAFFCLALCFSLVFPSGISNFQLINAGARSPAQPSSQGASAYVTRDAMNSPLLSRSALPSSVSLSLRRPFWRSSASLGLVIILQTKCNLLFNNKCVCVYYVKNTRYKNTSLNGRAPQIGTRIPTARCRM